MFNFLRSNKDSDGEEPEEHNHPTPEEDYAMASRAWEAGDHEHALHHLAALVAEDPTHPEWIGLLDSCIADAGDRLLEILNDKQDQWFGETAVLAYILAGRGEVEEALHYLIRLTQAIENDPRFLLSWGLDWVERFPAEGDRDVLSGFFSQIMIIHPELAYGRFEQIARLDRVRALLRPFIQGPKDILLFCECGLLRKAGRFSEALDAARVFHESRGDWQSAIALGKAASAMDRPDEAIEAFADAARLDPEDTSSLLEIGDIELDRGDYARARQRYDQALGINPDLGWARSSRLYCEFRLTEEDAHLDALLNLAEDGEERARGLFSYLAPYEGFVPEPTDATVNTARQIFDADDEIEPGAEGSVDLKLSHLEPPSNRLFFAREIERLRGKVELRVTTETIPRPDPRRSLRPVDFQLWFYEGHEPRPALPLPGEPAVERVRSLAIRPFLAHEWWRIAALHARELSRDDLEQTAAVMVHPPLRPEPESHSWITPYDWLPRVQLAAAMIIAQHPSPWSDSDRRRLLLDIGYGPPDWTTDAVLFVVARLTNQNPDDGALVTDAQTLFMALFEHMPRDAYCSYAGALSYHWRGLAGLDDDGQRFTEEFYQAVWHPDDED